ncbi:MAG: site-specific integrase [Terracidiphilus sp.]
MRQKDICVSTRTNNISDLANKVKAFVLSSRSQATVKAYRREWSHFERWCCDHGLAALPATAETVAMYIADCASACSVGTITRRLTAITKAHLAAGHPTTPATTKHFLVGMTLKGIKRVVGTAQHGKVPLLTADIRKLASCCPKRLLGLRDRALVLVGFSGAFRRSEISAIDVSHIRWCQEGIVLTLPKSKTDQDAAGREVGIPRGRGAGTCPVRALQEWLSEAGIVGGPVFRRVDRHGNISAARLYPDSISKLLKRAAARAGMSVDGISGHSLRAGHATQAARNGISELTIMRQTGHKSRPMVRRYIRRGQIFAENAAMGLGL